MQQEGSPAIGLERESLDEMYNQGIGFKSSLVGSLRSSIEETTF